MKLIKQQKVEILPFLQRAVQAKLEQWEAERNIERLLNQQFDDMNEAVEILAAVLDAGSEVTTRDVQGYIDICKEVT